MPTKNPVVTELELNTDKLIKSLAQADIEIQNKLSKSFENVGDEAKKGLTKATIGLNRISKLVNNKKFKNAMKFMPLKDKNKYYGMLTAITKKLKNVGDVTTWSVEKWKEFAKEVSGSSLNFEHLLEQSEGMLDSIDDIGKMLENVGKLDTEVFSPEQFKNVKNLERDLFDTQRLMTMLAENGQKSSKQFEELSDHAKDLKKELDGIYDNQKEKETNDKKELDDANKKYLIEKKAKTLLKQYSDIQGDILDIKKESRALYENEAEDVVKLGKNVGGVVNELSNMIDAGDINQVALEKMKDKMNEILDKTEKIGDTETLTAKQRIGNYKKELKIEEKKKKKQAQFSKADKKAFKEKRKMLVQEYREKGMSYFEAKKKAKAEMPQKFGLEGKADKIGKAAKPVADQIGGGVKALPGMGGLMGMLGMGGIAALIMALLDANKKIRDTQREMVSLAGTTGELGKNADALGGKINRYAQDAFSLMDTWGLGFEEAKVGFGAMAKAGYKMQDFLGKNIGTFKDFYAQAVLTGKSIDELAGIGSQLREEFGMRLPKDTTNAFIDIRESAVDAGIATGRFFDKVMNAASGMGIYGYKITTVAKSFAKLAKNVALPEKAATEMAQKMMQSFDSLDATSQLVASQASGLKDALSTMDEQKLIKFGFSKDQISSFAKITDPLARQMEALRNLNPMQKSFMKFTHALTMAGVQGIDLNSSGGIQNALDSLNSQQHKLVMTGQMSADEIIFLQKTMTQLSANEMLKNGKSLEDIKKYNKQAGENLEAQWKEAKNNGKTWGQFTGGLDTGFEGMKKLEEDSANDAKRAADRRQAAALREQTRSASEAIEQTIQGWIIKIYGWIERIGKSVISIAKKMAFGDANKRLINEDMYSKALGNLDETISKTRTELGKATKKEDRDKLEKKIALLEEAKVRAEKKYKEDLESGKKAGKDEDEAGKDAAWNASTEATGALSGILAGQEDAGTKTTRSVSNKAEQDFYDKTKKALEDLSPKTTTASTPAPPSTPTPEKKMTSVPQGYKEVDGKFVPDPDSKTPAKKEKQWTNAPKGYKLVDGKFIPLAKGGIVNKPTLSVIGEAGPEAVIPLKRFGDMTRQYAEAHPRTEVGVKDTAIVAGRKAFEKGGEKLGEKGLEKIAAKTGKFLLKKIPGLGLLASIPFAVKSYEEGDTTGAMMEIASGLASLVPVAGTAASVAIDAANIARKVIGVPEVVQPETMVANAGQNRTINDNRNITIVVNQRDQKTIEQAIRKEIYTDKLHG